MKYFQLRCQFVRLQGSFWSWFESDLKFEIRLSLFKPILRTLPSSVLIKCFLNLWRLVKIKLSSCLISLRTSTTAILVLQSSLIKYNDCWQMLVSSLISGIWYSATIWKIFQTVLQIFHSIKVLSNVFFVLKNYPWAFRIFRMIKMHQ